MIRALGLAIGVAVLLLATSPSLPLTWDEGESIGRALSLLRGEPWRHITESEGHPSGYAWVIAAGRVVAPTPLGEKTRWRFGPIILAAVACGLVAYRAAREVAPVAGVAAVVALVTTPRLFAHLHIAACDSPLVSMGLIALAVFDTKFVSWWRTILFGLVLGLAISMKFSGWLVPIPFIVFACVLMCREPRVLVHIVLALLIAVGVFVALHATLWSDPIGGLTSFVVRNVTREGLNIPTLFFGRLYNLDHPLPIWNTLAWTVLTLPVGHLVLVVTGIAIVLRTQWQPETERSGVTGSANWFRVVALSALVPLLARAIPGTPVHDAERLFVSSFAFLAVLAGLGAWTLLRRGLLGRTVVAVCAIAGVVPLVTYAPQWLSFYSEAVGGVRGAVALGFEPTYWWDGLDADVSDWLAANTPASGPAGGLVLVSATSTKTLTLQQEWGELPPRLKIERAAMDRNEPVPPCVWYVLQRRTSAMGPADVALVEREEPRWRKTCHGVPLVEIYAGRSED